MNITKGKLDSAQKVVVYGPEGIGKSTFASQFPDPVFIDTEGSTKKLDVARTPKPSSWTMLMEQVRYFRDNPNKCRTLAIDTADWAERLCVEHICSKSQKSGIEDFGYGKGYTYLEEEFGRFLNLLEDVVERGINVVITAHASMRKFEQPDELGAYDRWELKLEKKTAPLLKEWADMVLFANYKTYVVNVDGQGAQKGKNKAQGGKRVMYTTHHSCWDAKNRHELAEEIPFEYQAIAHCIPAGVPGTQVPARQEQQQPLKEPEKLPPVMDPPKEEKTAASTNNVNEQINKPDPVPDGIPKALADLMQGKSITESDIMEVVASKGYFPKDTPLAKCGEDFINGWVIPFFDKICEMSRAMKIARGEFVGTNPDEIPFN
jgi:hypothetical protein